MINKILALAVLGVNTVKIKNDARTKAYVTYVRTKVEVAVL